MNTDPLKTRRKRFKYSSKWQGKDGRGGQIDSAVLAAGHSMTGVLQSHHRTPVCHRGRVGKQKAGTQERNGSPLLTYDASLLLFSSVQFSSSCFTGIKVGNNIAKA